MSYQTDTLYKRTKKGGFVFWKAKTEPIGGGQYTTIVNWGEVGTLGKEAKVVFSLEFIARDEILKTFNKKKGEGLYHTLEDLRILYDKPGDQYYFDGQSNKHLRVALDHCLPRLDGGPANNRPQHAAVKQPTPPLPIYDGPIIYQLPRA